ncbi:acyl-CoA dehydrogenase [Amphritea opalescens]|uniref:Acyl-CoA dehydrogenase n=1 Tax=Amphritea opalescens TaxID=2490544 RepID=A0A430KUV8_9GAMM|nr:acyl-CoA dehydrogenase family protein [Amphritea opalescens]RTE67305.1 acyl-CoA dehydrogenase [Amphritea opalescens]
MNMSSNVQGAVNNATMTELESEMIRDAARNFANSESPLSVVRAAEAGDWIAAKASWSKMANLGWFELLQHEEDEADGLVAACVIAEELGRAAYPMPFSEAAVLVLPLLAKHAADNVSLDAFNSGEQRAAIAMPLSGLPTSIDRLPQLSSDVSLMVNLLEDASLLVVPVLDKEQPCLALVHRPENGWQTKAMPDLANNSYSRIVVNELKNVELIPLEWESLAKAYDYFRLVTAAYIVGLASQATDLAVEYAKERIAFGKPIGSFQAVQQRLAESALELAAAHFLVREASVTAERLQIPMACIQVCEAGKKATFTAQQIWAGMGYTLEVDVQLFFRRARAYQLLLGAPWELRERIWDEVVPHS